MPPKRRVNPPDSKTEAKKKQQEGALSKNVDYLKQKLAQLQTQLAEEEELASKSQAELDNSLLQEEDDEFLQQTPPSTSDAPKEPNPDEDEDDSKSHLKSISSSTEDLNGVLRKVISSPEELSPTQKHTSANDSDCSRDIFEDSAGSVESVKGINSSGQSKADPPELPGEPVDNVVPKTEYDKLNEKLSKKRVQYNNLRKRFNKLEMDYAELKEVFSDQAKENYKLKNRGEEVELFSTEEGIQLTSEQIKDISLASKNPLAFAQNLAVAIIGPDNLSKMSVTGRAWSQSRDNVAKPGIPDNILNFIYGKALERATLDKGRNKSGIIAASKPVLVNRALAEKIGNLQKARRLQRGNKNRNKLATMNRVRNKKLRKQSGCYERDESSDSDEPLAPCGRFERKLEKQARLPHKAKPPKAYFGRTESQTERQLDKSSGFPETAAIQPKQNSKPHTGTQPASARLVPSDKQSILAAKSSAGQSQSVERSIGSKKLSQKSELTSTHRKSTSQTQSHTERQLDESSGFPETAAIQPKQNSKPHTGTQPASARLVPSDKQSILAVKSSAGQSQSVERSIGSKKISQKSELTSTHRKSTSQTQPPGGTKRPQQSRAEKIRESQKTN